MAKGEAEPAQEMISRLFYDSLRISAPAKEKIWVAENWPNRNFVYPIDNTKNKPVGNLTKDQARFKNYNLNSVLERLSADSLSTDSLVCLNKLINHKMLEYSLNTAINNLNKRCFRLLEVFWPAKETAYFLFVNDLIEEEMIEKIEEGSWKNFDPFTDQFDGDYLINYIFPSKIFASKAAEDCLNDFYRLAPRGDQLLQQASFRESIDDQARDLEENCLIRFLTQGYIDLGKPEQLDLNQTENLCDFAYQKLRAGRRCLNQVYLKWLIDDIENPMDNKDDLNQDLKDYLQARVEFNLPIDSSFRQAKVDLT